jgi:hypothetical protein
MAFHCYATLSHIAPEATAPCPAGLWAGASPESHEQYAQHICASSMPPSIHPFRGEHNHDPQEAAPEQDEHGSCREVQTTQQARAPTAPAPSAAGAGAGRAAC